MPLTNIRIQNAKPKEKPYRLADSKGMYLEIMPNGSKYWRMKYRFLHKEKRLALGVYPEVSLIEARTLCDVARKTLSQGIDPSLAKKQEKQKAITKAANTFGMIAKEWADKQKDHWAERTAEKILRNLEKDVLPYIGSRPIADIEPPKYWLSYRK